MSAFLHECLPGTELARRRQEERSGKVSCCLSSRMNSSCFCLSSSVDKGRGREKKVNQVLS